MYSAKVVINVKDNVQFIIDKDLISFTCSENLKNANLDFTPGIFEQNASIELYDRDNTFKNIVQKYTDNFFYRSEVAIYIVEDDNETLLGNYIFDKIECDGADSVIKIDCIDYTYIFKEKYVSNSAVANRTLTQLLTMVFEMSLPSETWKFLDDATKNRCDNIVVGNSFVTRDTAYNILNAICDCGMLNIVFKQGVFYVGRCA